MAHKVQEYVNIDKQGGVEARDKGELARARDADLVTLPPDIRGTHCMNCKHVVPAGDGDKGVGYCTHPKLKRYVSDRQCCIFWSAPGEYRQWKK